MSSLRRQARLNNKTPLRLLRGVPDGAEVVIVGDDEGVENVKATLINGVEKDEISEHHLQAALSSSNLYHSTPSSNALPSSPSFRQAAAQPATQPLPAYQIPTPDAAGIVADYDTLYAKTTWIDPSIHIKFSEKVEETCYGWGGLAYDMDEVDEKWLGEFNAKEEGTSADAGQQAGRGERRGKGKDREKNVETGGSLRISEEEFEYVMGMFELWSEKNVPMLHTDLSLLPAFASFEPIFIETPPASFYPSYEVPSQLPQPRTLVRMARNIFTHWKSKKEIRKGKPIIPQLNVGLLKEANMIKQAQDTHARNTGLIGSDKQFDETNDGDPYLCFRRRDVKVARKTRQKDLMFVDRMKTVQGELKLACGIVALLLDREREKQRQSTAEKELWEAKHDLMMLKRQHPQMALTPEEESYLLTRPNNTQQMQPPMSAISMMSQGSSKRPRTDRDSREDSQRLQSSLGVPTPRISKSRPQSPSRDLPPPEQLAGMFARKVEEEMKRKKEVDRLWEDSTDLAYHPMPTPAPIRYFRPLQASELSPPQKASYRAGRDGGSSSPEPEEGRRTNHPLSFRLRRGRGGIMRLDRKIPSAGRYRSRRATRGGSEDEVAKGGKGLRRDDDGDVEMGGSDGSSSEDSEDEERERRLEERWAYDADQGRVGFGMDGVEGDQVVIDDFEVRYIKLRAGLITPQDMELLTPTRAALNKVNQLMLIPPERPPHVTFNRPMPQVAQMAQYQQQQHAIMQQRQVMEAQQRMLNANQVQGQFEVKPVYPMNGVPSPAMGHPQMGPQQLQQPQQLRRMASNGNGQVIGPRPPQSPARVMQQQQQLPQQAQQLVHAQAQAQAAQNEALRQMNTQRLQAQMQQQQQQQQQQNQGQGQQGQSMAPPMRVPSAGQQVGPLQIQGDVNGMPSNVRRISGNGMQPVQGDQGMGMNGRTPMMNHMQLPNGQMQMQVDMNGINGSINGVVQNQMQQSPRQPLAQSVPPLPNGVQVPNGGYDISAQMFANAANNTVLTPQAQAHMKAQILQQQQQAHQAKMVGMNGVVQGSPVNGQNGLMNLPVPQMNLKLPAGRAQMVAQQQGQLRSSGSPVHSGASGSPHMAQGQPVMQAVGGGGHQGGDF